MSGSGHRVVESFVAAREHGRPSADVVADAPGHVAVFDGVTVSEPCDCCGTDGGRLAATACAAALSTLDPAATMSTAWDVLAAAVAAAAAGRACRGRTWATTAVVVSVARREVWFVDDAVAVVDGRVERVGKRVDDVAAAFRSAVLHAELLRGTDVETLRADDPGRRSIAPLLQRQVQFRNRPAAGGWAYAGLTVVPPPAVLCRTVHVPPGPQEVVLASDGYPTVLGDLASTERALAARLAEDPLMIEASPQTKGVAPGAASFDDRAYVRVVLD